MSQSKPVVLVTGGAGFIGSHLIRRLLDDGCGVRVLDNLVTGKAANLDDMRERIEWLEGSVTDAPEVARAVQGVDTIFHEAAIPSVPRSVREPLEGNATNVDGTLNILNAAREAGVRRLVYASSSSAYGDSPTMPKEETMTPAPLSPYAVAKLAAEHYCQVWHRVYGFETVALRYFNVFGPRQDPQSEYAAVIPRFITAILEDRPITIYGDGEQSRDFTYIDNVIDINILAMNTTGDALGQTFNAACGERFSLNELVAQCGEIMGVEPEVQYLDARAGDVKHSLASIEKARALLGYEPRVKFREGLERTVEFFQSVHNARTPEPSET